jgi:hypothetical protein
MESNLLYESQGYWIVPDVEVKNLYEILFTQDGNGSKCWKYREGDKDEESDWVVGNGLELLMWIEKNNLDLLFIIHGLREYILNQAVCANKIKSSIVALLGQESVDRYQISFDAFTSNLTETIEKAIKDSEAKRKRNNFKVIK